ncbi:uncharacterized protein LOC112045958 [Bicyclus anynana]|uniref:Uncharacterized protein LOC112045958 n=1 Tax=Bicyclus anynana TaxID=110368 RepID=A0A6J1MUC2_BICAN|nr:uncharacterized protein LOC112045958 [Bicyclus anynana]
MDGIFTEKLLREVANRPIIYQPTHPDFKNRPKKYQAWREIQMELNEEIKPMKARWKNLKDTYNKYKQSRTTGDGTNKLTNWLWADHMTAIMEQVDPLNEVQIDLDIPTVKLDCNDNSPLSTTKIEEMWEDIESNQGSSVLAETSTVQESYRRNKRNSDPTDRIVEYLQNRKSARKRNDCKTEVKCDGVDLLFLGYSDTFKKLSNRKQISVKFEIAKILMKAELSDLQNDVLIVPTSPGDED